MNYIYFYNTLFENKLNIIIDKARASNVKTYCKKCKKEFDKIYTINNITIPESAIHDYYTHNMIDYKLYDKIMSLELDEHEINFYLLNTNDIHIIDALYEQGSNKVYIENKKNIYNSKINRFSEHSGFIYFKNNKLDKIVVASQKRIDTEDPSIYLPKNLLETLNVDYVFHTHPKTPFIGSRISHHVIYEFPSISDIIHFVEHHNKGKLIGSIILSPEGLYIIRKFNFNRDKIRLDYDIFVSELEDVFIDCYEDSMSKYASLLNYKSKIDNYKIPENIFYNNIANNMEYIKRINNYLEKYDITIDFYNRIKLDNKWILPDIYISYIN